MFSDAALDLEDAAQSQDRAGAKAVAASQQEAGNLIQLIWYQLRVNSLLLLRPSGRPVQLNTLIWCQIQVNSSITEHRQQWRLVTWAQPGGGTS